MINKKQLKELDKNVIIFKKELKEAGVKDSTIELVLRDIQEYQEEQIAKQLQEMKERMLEILRSEDDD